MKEARVEPSYDAWRAVARRLLADGVPPEDVLWTAADGAQELLPGLGEAVPQPMLPALDGRSIPEAQPARTNAIRGLRIPRELDAAARLVVHHRDTRRYDVLYRILWRIVGRRERHLLDIDVDPDVVALRRMERAVARSVHHAQAFVRFREVRGDDDGSWYVAWHESDHPILPLVAPFFERRFSTMRWCILTPDASARFDGAELVYGPGVPRGGAAPEDALEELWRTYYGAAFDPTRLRLRSMRAELPRRYWATLPETRALPELVRQAPARVAIMQERAASLPRAEDYLPTSRDLPSLARAVRQCEACALCGPATQAVFGEGPAGARLVLVGEQPGDQEDLQGKPFVGPAGEVLDRALHLAGLQRDQVYLTNAVKHFKFVRRGKRRLHQRPAATELAACRPWLEEELRAIRPSVIVCLGQSAARTMLGAPLVLGRVRGRVVPTAWAPSTVATWHPSAILRADGGGEAEQRFGELVLDLQTAAADLQAPWNATRSR